MLTLRLAVVHSLPSAIRLEEAIVPDRFWSFAERCVEPAPPTNPNAILSAVATALIRPVVMLSRRYGAIAECVFADLTSPRLTERSLTRIPPTKAAVLNGLTSTSGQRTYDHAIRQFVAWYCSEPRLAFNRTVVLRYRIQLEQRGYAAQVKSRIKESGV